MTLFVVQARRHLETVLAAAKSSKTAAKRGPSKSLPSSLLIQQTKTNKIVKSNSTTTGSGPLWRHSPAQATNENSNGDPMVTIDPMDVERRAGGESKNKPRFEPAGATIAKKKHKKRHNPHERPTTSSKPSSKPSVIPSLLLSSSRSSSLSSSSPHLPLPAPTPQRANYSFDSPPSTTGTSAADCRSKPRQQLDRAMASYMTAKPLPLQEKKEHFRPPMDPRRAGEAFSPAEAEMVESTSLKEESRAGLEGVRRPTVLPSGNSIAWNSGALGVSSAGGGLTSKTTALKQAVSCSRKSAPTGTATTTITAAVGGNKSPEIAVGWEMAASPGLLPSSDKNRSDQRRPSNNSAGKQGQGQGQQAPRQIGEPILTGGTQPAGEFIARSSDSFVNTGGLEASSRTLSSNGSECQKNSTIPMLPPAVSTRNAEGGVFAATEGMVTGVVAVAGAWAGAEASRLKRDAQRAKKRSWEDFCVASSTRDDKNDVGNNSCGASTKQHTDTIGKAEKNTKRAVRPANTVACVVGGKGSETLVKTAPRIPISGATDLLLSSASTSGGPAMTTSVTSKTANSSIPSSATKASRSSKMIAKSCGAITANNGSVGISSDVTVNGGGGGGSGGDGDSKLRTGVVETPEVAAARAALKEAETEIGIDLPSQDKGPPDAEAVCLLCPVPRGAFLRAERSKLGATGWCHCLCALSKGLPIEDRVEFVSV